MTLLACKLHSGCGESEGEARVIRAAAEGGQEEGRMEMRKAVVEEQR